MISEPTLDTCSISKWREESRRNQEDVRTSSCDRSREVFSSAKRGGSGTAEELEREAKTEEMSPSFLGP